MKKLLVSFVMMAAILSATASTKETTEKRAKSTENNAPALEAAAPTITLTGKVIDLNSGESLTGVEVALEGSSLKAYTDFDGNFTFEKLKPGEYNIIASFISYNKSYIEKFDAEKNHESINIKLQAAQ